ncbi:sensor histidine kinase [Chitinimonas koreensis]|uniref:sensor histidine kinase n=1 Tax=Chitinimonas koreensis TaxID=356302 RepID=UPI00146FB288|nr:sensor histidine kinase [Chitinimonas koreensis]QNM96892.1 sensor histidine kinase [Chitinimonas koreensis]
MQQQDLGDEGERYTFTVAAALLKELGERLVGKPFVALAELVKNAYDADATRVHIRFEPDAIEVVDNGDGMSKEDFKNYWMRVGTTHKQGLAETKLYSRQVSGSKGVGRLSVQFLGNILNLWSVSRAELGVAFRAHVDWHSAQSTQDLVNAGATVFRADAEGALPSDFRHGTRVRIEGLNQEWTDEMLESLATELWFLRPPAQLHGAVQPKDKFDIHVEGVSDKSQDAFDTKLGQAFASWIAEIEGEIKDGRSGQEASVTITLKGRKPEKKKYPLKHGALDLATFRIRVYKLTGKQSGGIAVQDARDYFRKFGGVHIYDQNFRLPFYGGEGDDWLGLEYDHSHRLILSKLVPNELRGDGDLRFLPTNGRVFGIVNVSTNHEREVASVEQREKGAHLNVQVTRDRLIDNAAMDDLRTLVRWSLDYYAYLASARKYKEDELGGGRPIKPTEPVFDEIRERLSNLRADVPPQAAAVLHTIDNRIAELFSIEKDREKRFHRERILLGALATAGMGAIALEHELGKELTALRDAIAKLSELSPDFSTELDVGEIKQGLDSLVNRITDARKLLSPLMEPDNRDLEAPMRLKPLIESIILDIKPLLRSAKVEIAPIDENLRLPKATQAAWSAIFQNVVVNAVNATIDTPAKRIRISTQQLSGNRVSVLVEDNGVGVDLEEASVLFEPFERRLELSDERKRLGLGGVGLGLTIVRMVAQSVGCDVQFTKPSPNMKTAFELSWKQDNEKSSGTDSHRRRRT